MIGNTGKSKVRHSSWCQSGGNFVRVHHVPAKLVVFILVMVPWGWNSSLYTGADFLNTKLFIRIWEWGAHNRYRGKALEQGRETGKLHSTSHNLWLRDFLSQRRSLFNISLLVLSNAFIYDKSNSLPTWTWNNFAGIFILKARDNSEHISKHKSPQVAYRVVLRNLNLYLLPSLQYYTWGEKVRWRN